MKPKFHQHHQHVTSRHHCHEHSQPHNPSRLPVFRRATLLSISQTAKLGRERLLDSYFAHLGLRCLNIFVISTIVRTASLIDGIVGNGY